MNSKNMTEGNILKCISFFAIPLLIGNIFQQLYNVADTAIIGNLLGDDALAAVGAATPVYGLLIGLTMGLTNGFAIIVARYFGASDEMSMKKSVTMIYMLAGLAAVLVTIVGIITMRPLMSFLGTPDQIIDNTVDYMMIIMLFSVATVAYNMFAGLMRAIGNSRVPLYFLMVSTFVNIGLDFLFVAGFGLGIAGAAYGTVISQFISAGLCYIFILKKYPALKFDPTEAKQIVSALIRKRSRERTPYESDQRGRVRSILSDLISTGLSMSMMWGVIQVGSVILQGAVNSFGTDTITAHSAARKIDDIFMLPMGSISLATSTFTSQNFGAGKMDRVKKGIRTAIGITTCWSVFSILFVTFFDRAMVQMLTGTENVRILSTATRYIVWNVSFFAVLGVLFVLRSSLQGVGRKIVPLAGSFLEFAMKIFAVIVMAPTLGYFGVCILEPIIWVLSAMMVVADYIVFSRKTSEGYRLAHERS